MLNVLFKYIVNQQRNPYKFSVIMICIHTDCIPVVVHNNDSSTYTIYLKNELKFVVVQRNNNHSNTYTIYTKVDFKGVGMIRVDFGPISETAYIDIILNTIIER